MRTHLVSVTALVVGALAPAQTPLHQSRSVEDLLPASTYAAVKFAGLDACSDATARMPIAGLVKQFLARLPREVVEQQLEEGLAEAADDLREALHEVGLRPADARAVVGRPMTLAVGRFSIEGMGPSVALLLDEGNERPAINRCVRALSRLPERFGVDVTIERIEIGGHPFYRAQAAEGPPVFAGSIAGTYCLSNSRGFLREIAAVAAGRDRGLVAASDFAALRQQFPALALCMVNTRSVMDSLAPHLPYEAADFADAIGLGRVDSIYAAAAAGEEGGAEMLHIAVRGSEKGLLKALVSKPVDLGFARACSPNTVLFGAGSCDVPAVIGAFRRFVELLPREVQREIRRELGRELRRELAHAGTSPQEVHRILSAFGNQVGFAIALEKGAMPKPELLVHVGVRDAETIGALLLRVEAMTAREGGVEWRSRKVEGGEVRFCNLKVDGSFQVSPCYYLGDDGLWIGSDAAGLVRALRRVERPANSLVGQEDFARLAAAAAGQSGVLHLRSFRGIELGWRSIETMLYPLVDANEEELGFDSDALPDGDELAEALGSTTVTYKVDESGITVRTRGTYGWGAILAGVGTLCDEVLSRATAKVF
ncbi:MAG TPA: hypothetical protein ENI87_00175 [bacterium]|nr:hypothetical protein [bacterium]